MSFTPQDLERRRRAKRYNEQTKLLAAFCNNLGVGTIVGAMLVPLASERSPPGRVFEIWVPIAIILHLTAQVACGGCSGARTEP